VPGRLYFRLRTRPVCNVHLVEQNGTHWVNNLAFRDYLRHSPGAARQYEMVKCAAVNGGATTLVAYSLVKSSVVEALLTRGGLSDMDRSLVVVSRTSNRRDLLRLRRQRSASR
jgi:hypothetical protein